jgi:hypothetical protein
MTLPPARDSVSIMSSSGKLTIVIFDCGGHGRVVSDTLTVRALPCRTIGRLLRLSAKFRF